MVCGGDGIENPIFGSTGMIRFLAYPPQTMMITTAESR